MDCRGNICLLIWTLLCNQISAIQYTPVDIGDLTDCALILKPNAQQYTSNLLQSDSGGPVNCITYDAINQAYLDARKRIDIPRVEDDWKSEEVAAVGQLILDVSQQIAKEYNLNQEDIEIGLTQIDAMKTPIKDICPVYLSAITCRAGKYRRHDGLCNNIDHPTWGATMTPFSRLLPPQFSDSISSPRISNSGKSLPTARMVSRTIHVDEGYHDHAGTVMLVAWGQFTDHDLTLMGTPLDSQNRNEPEECCYRPEHLKNPYCMEITIPEDDYFYRKFNVRCQDFVRAFPGVQPNCRLGSRNPFNTLTAVIDGNTVYGSNEQFARQLRAGYGGLLKMNPAFSQLGLKELLPMKTDVPDEGCVRTNHSQFCFLAGEIRVNEQLVLTCIHTLMAREHNRIAKELSAINPHWDDEILYQEARRITVAEIQHVTFNEFLPLILGKEIMEKYGLVLNDRGYWDGYNPQANPGIMDAFSAAAFRFGHSLLPSAIERWSKVHKFIASKRLSELIRRPYDLYRAGVIDEYFMGLLNQVAQAMDDSVTQEVTNHLLKKPGNRFGFDLVSFNIQRGRDFGLPGYMYFRQHCGLPTADTFQDMFGSMPNSTIYRYMTIYESPWDIDLWSGGVSEKPLPGSMVGPTFACIIATQMSMIRQGDRFWYELPNQPSSFTPEQLQEIKKVKLSRILCDNTDLIDTVQIYAMVLPDHIINPRVPCRSSVLPKLDLSHWVDIPTKSFDDKAQNHTTFIRKRDSVSNETQSPSAYEYHIKTIAIIEGSNPQISVNDILSSNPSIHENIPYENYDSNHKISKRSTNSSSNVNATRRSDEVIPSASIHIKNITSSNSSATGKDVIKRQSYHPRQKFKKPRPEAEMTQAIMDDSPQSDADSNYRRSSTYPAEEDHDIEDFFRKNVPIYDGVPIARKGSRYTHPESKRYHYYAPQEEEEEEEEEEKHPMKGLLEVDPDMDTEHELVPMTLDEYGRARVVDGEFENEGEDAPDFPYPSKSHQSYSDDNSDFKNVYNKPYSHPYNFEPSHSSFKSHDYDHTNGYSDTPPKYGTSHQYNSLADDQPRYYKHFTPSYRSQYDDDDKERPSYSYPSTTHHIEHPKYSSYSNHDFVPVRGNLRAPYTSKYPPRTTHVPKTLEEYHRIHGHFDMYKNKQKSNPYTTHSSVIVPQDDKEDDEEEKDIGDPAQGPKSFVTLNFGTGLNSDDDGISFRHQIGHIKPKFSYSSSKPSYDDHDNVEFPAETAKEGSSSFSPESPGSIKSFVESIFKKKQKSNYVPDIITGKNYQPVSPYNPHFGERVKQRAAPSQNILWHRKASNTEKRATRDKSSRNKNDRDLHVENTKMYDDLVKDHSSKPAKRDVDEKEPQNRNDQEEENNEENKSAESQDKPAENGSEEDDNNPQFNYWSQSSSQPN